MSPVIPFETNFHQNFRTRISPIQSKSSHLEILGLELLLDQKILLNTLMIILVEAVILRLMKKLKNLLKDQEDRLHHKNIINNRNIISHQLKHQCMMQMKKVNFEPATVLLTSPTTRSNSLQFSSNSLNLKDRNEGDYGVAGEMDKTVGWCWWRIWILNLFEHHYPKKCHQYDGYMT